MTPLMLAASRNDSDTVHQLIANGARSFWRDPQGRFAYELTTDRALAQILRDAFMRDQTDLTRVAEAAAIKDPLPFLLKLTGALPASDREWSELCRRLAADVRWLKNRSRFNDPTEAVQKLPPGPYRMYVERPDKAVKSCPEDLQVSFRQKRFTFVAPANTSPRCQ